MLTVLNICFTCYRYLRVRASNTTKFLPDGNYVIAMAVLGEEADCLYGALRNAQLMRLLMPQWTLVIFTNATSDSSPKSGDNIHRFRRQYKRLGAQIRHVNSNKAGSHPSTWPLDVIAEKSIDAFEIRSCYNRLNERDVAVIYEWLMSQKAIHIIRDHPQHASRSLVPELWGGRPHQLEIHASSFVHEIKSGTRSDQALTNFFLNDTRQTISRNNVLFHDGVTCSNLTVSKPILHLRQFGEYLGQRFTQYHVPVFFTNKQADKFPGVQNATCTGAYN